MRLVNKCLGGDEYSFRLTKFKWIFDEEVMVGAMRASMVVIELFQNCFCRSERETIEEIVKDVVDRLWLRMNNEKLKNLEIRFVRCGYELETASLKHTRECIDVDLARFFANFEYLKAFKHDFGCCSIKFFF